MIYHISYIIYLVTTLCSCHCLTYSFYLSPSQMLEIQWCQARKFNKPKANGLDYCFLCRGHLVIYRFYCKP